MTRTPMAMHYRNCYRIETVLELAASVVIYTHRSPSHIVRYLVESGLNSVIHTLRVR